MGVLDEPEPECRSASRDERIAHRRLGRPFARRALSPELGNGFGLTAYGDVGGFGLGAHVDWQVIGTIDYALNSSSNLRWVIAASILIIRRATAIWASMFT